MVCVFKTVAQNQYCIGSTYGFSAVLRHLRVNRISKFAFQQQHPKKELRDIICFEPPFVPGQPPHYRNKVFLMCGVFRQLF